MKQYLDVLRDIMENGVDFPRGKADSGLVKSICCPEIPISSF